MKRHAPEIVYAAPPSPSATDKKPGWRVMVSRTEAMSPTFKTQREAEQGPSALTAGQRPAGDTP